MSNLASGGVELLEELLLNLDYWEALFARPNGGGMAAAAVADLIQVCFAQKAARVRGRGTTACIWMIIRCVCFGVLVVLFG